jgi:hypothetical protein
LKRQKKLLSRADPRHPDKQMSRNPTFTQAQVRRAVKAAESAGLTVRRVTIGRDGSITVDCGEPAPEPKIEPRHDLAASWDDLDAAQWPLPAKRKRVRK